MSFIFQDILQLLSSFLTEGITNAEELFLKAMDQEVLNLIELLNSIKKFRRIVFSSNESRDSK